MDILQKYVDDQAILKDTLTQASSLLYGYI